jgi:hypothetical protein
LGMVIPPWKRGIVMANTQGFPNNYIIVEWPHPCSDHGTYCIYIYICWCFECSNMGDIMVSSQCIWAKDIMTHLGGDCKWWLRWDFSLRILVRLVNYSDSARWVIFRKLTKQNGNWAN